MKPPNENLAPCLIVIFGASGDLTARKLIPSLYDLFVGGFMPAQTSVLGVARTAMSDDDFRTRMKDAVAKHSPGFDAKTWDSFAASLHYLAADPTAEAEYPRLKERMARIAKAHGTGENVLFYLSLAPQFYEPVIVNIGSHQMITEGKAWCSINRQERSWQRIIVEKPFGHDVESAAYLNRALGRVFEDESVFRIDHYLGKETVQNLLVFRFANAIFEPIWSRQYIDHVQVTAAETVGVESRGSYYASDSGGAMRDMIQSHLLQVMALVAMEPPVTMRAEDIRAETTKVLNAARILSEDEISACAVRGQYVAGSIAGQPVSGFKDEKGVPADSRAESYAALQVMIDTWRWNGVPFYLRSGKRMAKKTTEIVVEFKPTPHGLFGKGRGGPMANNQIVINVQPNEGIRLRFEGKVPGIGMKIRSVVMDFDYCRQFQAQPMEAYATLLLDAMRGDQTLFKQRQEIEQSWRIVQPVLAYWAEHTQEPLPVYPAGTWGPPAADILLAREGRQWRNPPPEVPESPVTLP
ncbi:MAG: glucose-6-phosphate dehydrogenase [Phycisphaeraceae bacterium]|nr:glucose-6-phosphate dehydrogenase [Phycisphaeraceae bacterium]